jgi:hypothetical protein
MLLEKLSKLTKKELQTVIDTLHLNMSKNMSKSQLIHALLNNKGAGEQGMIEQNIAGVRSHCRFARENSNTIDLFGELHVNQQDIEGIVNNCHNSIEIADYIINRYRENNNTLIFLELSSVNSDKIIETSSYTINKLQREIPLNNRVHFDLRQNMCIQCESFSEFHQMIYHTPNLQTINNAHLSTVYINVFDKLFDIYNAPKNEGGEQILITYMVANNPKHIFVYPKKKFVDLFPKIDNDWINIMIDNIIRGFIRYLHIAIEIISGKNSISSTKFIEDLRVFLIQIPDMKIMYYLFSTQNFPIIILVGDYHIQNIYNLINSYQFYQQIGEYKHNEYLCIGI